MYKIFTKDGGAPHHCESYTRDKFGVTYHYDDEDQGFGTQFVPWSNISNIQEVNPDAFRSYGLKAV